MRCGYCSISIPDSQSINGLCKWCDKFYKNVPKAWDLADKLLRPIVKMTTETLREKYAGDE